MLPLAILVKAQRPGDDVRPVPDLPALIATAPSGPPAPSSIAKTIRIRFRDNPQTVSLRELLPLPRQQEAREGFELPVLHVRRLAHRAPRAMGRGRQQAAGLRDAAARGGPAATKTSGRRSPPGSSSELDRIDRDTPPDPGRVTARRLNRTEYNNTVRDLLGVDSATGRRLSAGRCRLRLRQHRGRAVAVARADGEVRVRRRIGSRGWRSSGRRTSSRR